jgi:hypothetical protein
MVDDVSILRRGSVCASSLIKTLIPVPTAQDVRISVLSGTVWETLKGKQGHYWSTEALRQF